MACDEEGGCRGCCSNLYCYKSKKKDPVSPKRNEEDYFVAGKYRVANYNSTMVSENMNYSFLTNRAIRSMFDPRYISQTILGKTKYILLLFLLFWIVLQVLMQTGFICPPELTGTTGATGATTSPQKKIKTTQPQGGAAKRVPTCTPAEEKQLNNILKSFQKQDALAATYLVFIVGFYVKQLVSRWWEQVKSLPEIDSITNYISGLVFDKAGGPMGVSEATLNLSKTVSRYALLSWAMCMSSISKPMHETFSTKKNFIDKGLLTEEEFTQLQVGTTQDGWKDQWMIPISWAVCDANVAINKSKIIPKDHKNLVGALNQYQHQLNHLKRIHKNPLPLIYKQAVTVCMWAWLVLGVVASQGSFRDLVLHGIIYNFPFYQAIKIILLFGWLKVSEMIRNPFGTDLHFDIDLVEKLDVEIWKASVAIRNIDQIFP